jgi:hypothetical protein
MRYIYFDKPGKMDLNEKAILFTSQRKKRKNDTIFHRNDINNRIAVPSETLKYYFTYDRNTGIYKSQCKWGTLVYGGDVKIETETY